MVLFRAITFSYQLTNVPKYLKFMKNVPLKRKLYSIIYYYSMIAYVLALN